MGRTFLVGLLLAGACVDVDEEFAPTSMNPQTAAVLMPPTSGRGRPQPQPARKVRVRLTPTWGEATVESTIMDGVAVHRVSVTKEDRLPFVIRTDADVGIVFAAERSTAPRPTPLRGETAVLERFGPPNRPTGLRLTVAHAAVPRLVLTAAEDGWTFSLKLPGRALEGALPKLGPHCVGPSVGGQVINADARRALAAMGPQLKALAADGAPGLAMRAAVLLGNELVDLDAIHATAGRPPCLDARIQIPCHAEQCRMKPARATSDVRVPRGGMLEVGAGTDVRLL